MVIGLLPDIRTTDVALNNLAEAGFDPDTISVVSSSSIALTAKPSGPFKNISVLKLADKLVSLRLDPATAKQYQTKVQAGKVFIAINVSKGDSQNAITMLNDYKPELIRTI